MQFITLKIMIMVVTTLFHINPTIWVFRDDDDDDDDDDDENDDDKQQQGKRKRKNKVTR